MGLVKVKIRKFDYPDDMPEIKTTHDGRSFDDWIELGMPEDKLRNDFGLNHPDDFIDVELKPYSSVLIFNKEDFDYIVEEPKGIFNISLKNGKSFELLTKKEIKIIYEAI